MLENYCVKRQVEFSKRFCKQKIELFGFLGRRMVDQNYKPKDLKHLVRYFENLARMYSNFFDFTKVRDLVLQYFEYCSEIVPELCENEDYFFVGLTAFLEHLVCGLIGKGGQYSNICLSPMITDSSLEMAIVRDAELMKTHFLHLNLLEKVDLNYFYGSTKFGNGNLPPIKMIQDEEVIIHVLEPFQVRFIA